MKKLKSGFVLGVILLSSLLVYFVKVNIAWMDPVIMEHVTCEQIPRSGIPQGGTDYSCCFYRMMPRGPVYCECTMTEKSFNDWVSSESRWKNRTDLTEENPEHIHDSLQHDSLQKRRDIIVSDGIRFQYGDEGGHGGYTVFDRSTNRAYYWTYY
ncbi:MAG: hypothetical protein FWH27_13880 [Planctomycetaceae bacterium]|nr:hypothetical protein [Planctomycetaceae bacterium]